ncbi:hypothetical protein A7U60_g336 [Sanghuangporus baumii]|uniref:BTB domain-containing protein n=1 Tax=Sanghuangporus baumii TaxID=108892 RepID=A0A9Q5I641_SANBA|nr:hypothetical protein A7U60_g336 [Sanghuangporus baumii]
MTALHVHFALRNQQAFQRLLDASRGGTPQIASGPTLSTSGGRSWNKPSPLSGGIPVPSCDVNARDWLGRTVLHLAVSSLDPAALEFVKLLLSHPRIDVNTPDLESRWTALHRALYVANIPACVLLLQRADIDVSLKDFEGYTAFDVYNSTVEGTKPSELELTDLYTWGTNRNAALGLGDGDDRAFPELVPIPPQKEHSDTTTLSLRTRFQPIRAKQVAMAKLHTAVITSEPRANLRICGFGSGGRLGAGMGQFTQYTFSVPKDLTSEAQITAVALGQDHTLALTCTGSVLSWGLARFSQLGYALDGGQTLQAAPRRIVGPLKKETAVGVAACRTASACWTRDELFTWGTNNGQLGYDRAGTPVQVVPRRVTQITLAVIDAALSDTALAVLLSSRDVHCFQNGRNFKINFPTQSFPSEIQVYRPPMAQHNANIAKVVNCDNTFAALSSNGEVFTFAFSEPPPVFSSDPNAHPTKAVGVTPVKPQRIWALRKQISAVKDVALGSDGTILLCTESGHVYFRSRTNKTSKFTRVPLLQRVVSVAASSAGSFAALKAECSPAPINLQGNTVAEDLRAIQPYNHPRADSELKASIDTAVAWPPTPPSTDGQTGVQRSSTDEDDVESDEDGVAASVRKDVSIILSLIELVTRDAVHRKAESTGLFTESDDVHGADLTIKLDSGFEFPAHCVVFASRSQALKKVLVGETILDASGRPCCRIIKNKLKSSRPVMILSGIHPLSALMLATYLYTDEIPAIWDRRVLTSVADRLVECSPRADAMSIHGDLQKLSSLLRLPVLTEALNTPVKRPLEACLTHDMKVLFESMSQDVAWASSSPVTHPLAPDTVLELADAHVYCHSTILRARSPFFSAFFGNPEWTVNRRRSDHVLTVKFEHRRQRVMEYIMSFIYIGGNEELFDIMNFVQSVDDVVDFLFEVMDAAGELLLDRLLLACSSVILQFLNINNACSILSDASHFNAEQLVSSVHGYLARNLETLLESRMLGDLPVHLLRQLAEFIRARQSEKLPVTRSGMMVEKALETWKDWLALQDIPQPIVPGRKPYAGHIRHSPKLSPEMIAATSKRNRRPSAVKPSASYSPPQDLRHPITSPSAPVQETVETGSDDIFVMDDVQDIPPLNLFSAQDSTSSVTPKDGPLRGLGMYSPWKARISQLPSSKLDLRAIMAEAEDQRKISVVSGSSPQPRSRVIGFDASSVAQTSRTAQKGASIHDSQPMKTGESSPWQTPRTDRTSGRLESPVGSSPILSRQVSGTQSTSISSGLGHDIREKQTAVNRVSAPLTSTSSNLQQGQAILGKGKAPLGPTSTPTRQAAPPTSADPITRRVSEGTNKAWTTMQVPSAPLPSENASMSTTPPSFLAIQQQQRDQNAGPSHVKKSLLEIQAEEQARVAEERAIQEEIEFMRWWAAEEDRIRRETQAQPGPPIPAPGAGRGHRGGKKEKGKGTGDPRKPGQANKKSGPTSSRIAVEGGGETKQRGAATENQKGGARSRAESDRKNDTLPDKTKKEIKRCKKPSPPGKVLPREMTDRDFLDFFIPRHYLHYRFPLLLLLLFLSRVLKAMKSRTGTLGLVLVSACCSAVASSSWDIHDYPYPDHRFKAHTRAVQRRGIVTDADVQDSYDFIIVGGGTAGLVIASRLSEDSNHTVLVLEAGDTGDAVRTQIDTPGDTYYDGLSGSSYDWSFTTTAQSQAAGRSLTWPRGKVLGGSSAINGLYSVRANKLEHDTWASLQDNADGADAWNWDNQFAAYKTAETFSAPDSVLASNFSLEYSADSHGSSGPVDVSWPAFEVPIVAQWVPTLEAAGIPLNADPYSGSNAGTFIALSTIDPTNHTRSYSRSAYIDPLPPRSNLAILANATVTKIDWSTSDSSNITATGVTYQLTGSSTTRTISVNKEVILAGGAVGSPHVLMLSGVGPSDVLSAAGVDVVLDLPGVGQHLQDHIAAGISWTTTAETYASIRDSGNTDPSFLSFVNGAEAYINLTTLFGQDQAETYQQEVSSAIDSNADSLVASSDETVKEGYKAIQHAITDTFMLSELGHVELLFSVQGQKGSSSQSVMIQCALQRPLSIGRLYINSSDPFTAPVIDPWYLSNSFDVTAMREGLKLARTVGQTSPLSDYFTGETSPGSSVSTDEDWEDWLRSNFATEYHPANTCAMLPQSKGGVVDPKLKVYGTSNVRVADASVFPIQFSSHLMMSVYALAETASEIIRAEYNGVLAPGETASSSSNTTSTGGSTAQQTDSSAFMGARPLSSPAIGLVILLSVLGAVFAV